MDAADVETVDINLDSVSGVLELAAYRVKDRKKAERFLARAKADIIAGGKLFGASYSPQTQELTGQAAGTEQKPYQISISLQTHEEGSGHPDWAESHCTCKAAEGNNLCKHILALLLARLDRDSWQAAQREQPASQPQPAQAGTGQAGGAQGAVGDRAPDAAAAAAAISRASAAAATMPSAQAAAGRAGGKQGAGGVQAPGTAAAAAAIARAAGAAGSGVPAPMRKRVLPGALAADVVPAAKKGRGPAVKGEPPKTPMAAAAKAPRAGVQKQQAAGAREAAAAAAGAPGPAGGTPFVVRRRLRGRELLVDSDEELMRQCREVLNKNSMAERPAAVVPAAGQVDEERRQRQASADTQELEGLLEGELEGGQEQVEMSAQQQQQEKQPGEQEHPVAEQQQQRQPMAQQEQEPAVEQRQQQQQQQQHEAGPVALHAPEGELPPPGAGPAEPSQVNLSLFDALFGTG